MDDYSYRDQGTVITVSKVDAPVPYRAHVDPKGRGFEYTVSAGTVDQLNTVFISAYGEPLSAEALDYLNSQL